MHRFLGTTILSISVLASQSLAQDAQNKWCEDILIKLARAMGKEGAEKGEKDKAPSPPSQDQLRFPLDLTKADAAKLAQARRQISTSTGQDLLVIDQCSLARPEVQEFLKEAPGRLILKTKDEDAATAKAILGSHSKAVLLLTVIPTTLDEVKAVYGNRPSVLAAWTAARLRVVDQGLQGLETLKTERRVTAERPTLVKDIVARIDAAAEGEFVVIVGHNGNGILRLPSGDSVPAAELNERLSGKSLKGVLITCESMECACERTENEVLTNRKLRLDEIACALRAAIAAYIADTTCGANDNVLRQLAKALATCFKAMDARFKIAVGVVGTALLTATVVELNDLDSNPKAPGDGSSPDPAARPDPKGSP
jgi:hypothetical protein